MLFWSMVSITLLVIDIIFGDYKIGVAAFLIVLVLLNIRNSVCMCVRAHVLCCVCIDHYELCSIGSSLAPVLTYENPRVLTIY